MPAKVDFIAPASASNELIALSDIPKPVQELAEKIFEHVRKTGSRVRLTWDTEAEMRTELRQLASYAQQRRQGVLKFRISPTKGLTGYVKDVRLTADIVENAQQGANGNGQVAARA